MTASPKLKAGAFSNRIKGFSSCTGDHTRSSNPIIEESVMLIHSIDDKTQTTAKEKEKKEEDFITKTMLIRDSALDGSPIRFCRILLLKPLPGFRESMIDTGFRLKIE